MKIKRNRTCGRAPACAALLAAVMLMFGVAGLRAQQVTGRILGNVLDASGSAVPNAQITITNQETGVVRNTVSTSDGLYADPQVPPGIYTVGVQAQGFRPAEIKDVLVTVGSDSRADLKIAVGSVTQEVTVTEAAPQVDTTSSSIGGTVDEQKVSDLPLNGRNWADLTLMQAGVSQLRNGGQIGGAAGNVYSVNGADVRSNTYLLDGAIMNNLFVANNGSILGSSLGVDGIKEYKVVTSGFSAEYGLLMGSQQILVSKGGTNAWHGDAYDYLRNSVMDAAQYFENRDTTNLLGFGTDKSFVYPNKRLPPFIRNNFGGAFGGPIKKDKTFFHAVFEGLRQRLGATVTTTTLPAGCFTAASTASSYTPLGTAANPFTTPAQVNACAKSASLPPGITLPFVETAAVQAEQSVFPYPNIVNNPAFNYSFRWITPSMENYGQLRVDQNFSAKDTAFFRYTHDDADQTQNLSYQQILNAQHSAFQYITVSENHIFTPTLLNTLRASFSRTQLIIDDKLNAAIGVTAPPLIEVGNGPWGGASPGGGVTGFAGVGNRSPFPGNLQNIITGSDDIFWSKGKHAFKFGVLYNHFQDTLNDINFATGSVGHGNIGAFLTGNYNLISFVTADTNQNKSFIYNTLGFYGQDDWRVLPRVTLNLGLRYEFYTSMPHTISTQETWSTPDPLTAAPPNFAIRTPAVSTNPSLHNFSPRIGFAWDIFGNGKTSLRGSAGIFYNVGLLGGFLTNVTWEQPPTEKGIIISNANPTPCLKLVFPMDLMLTATPLTTPCPTGNALFSFRSAQYYAEQPTMGEWNASIQQQLPWGMALGVSYAGSKGWHLQRIEEGNPTIPAGLDSRGLPYYCNPADGTPGPPTFAHPCGSSFVPQRPNTLLGPYYIQGQDANSWYNAAMVTLTKRLSHGLQFQANFTFEHQIDDGQNAQGTDNTQQMSVLPQYKNIDKGTSIYNIPTNFRFNAIYHFPGLKSNNILAKFAQGWWTAGILAVQSGGPFDIYVGVNRSLQAASKGIVDRPSFNSSYDPKTFITGNINRWYDATMLDVPPAGTLGNTPVNLGRGPNFRNLDFSMNKDTHIPKLGESGMVQFRLEVFNIFNHPNFNVPTGGGPSGGPVSALVSLANGSTLPCGGQAGAAVTCPGGGSGTFTLNANAQRITSTVTSSRQMQLSLKLIF
jgi:outer membrane receptor protein involved in Fe transport